LSIIISGIHHLGLTVRDVEASAAWYERVLGFHRSGWYESPDGARRKVFLDHTGLGVRVGLTQHREGSQDDFDETHVGLDHLAFTVRDRVDLETWAVRLTDAGVTCSPIAPARTMPGMLVLVLRDPDKIQLELVAETSSLPPE
jgi:catechol 2,3-dioxygenase-like lactoylglutathione lyase family enzyme